MGKTDYRAQVELTVYKAIESQGITPKVLALIAADDSSETVGFVLQYIEGRIADTNDKAACKALLKTLHGTGWAHFDPHPGNFIVSSHGIYMIDFEYAMKATPELEQHDFAVLEDELVG